MRDAVFVGVGPEKAGPQPQPKGVDDAVAESWTYVDGTTSVRGTLSVDLTRCRLGTRCASQLTSSQN
jgi:hypothetical protein